MLRVVDTQYGLPELVVHHAVVEAGSIADGDEVTAEIDADRRDAIRRNHTATHLLHWALREVLGTHVQQAGSMVAPDRLRFDFSHFEAVTPEELERIETLANAEVITDAPVRHYETTKDHAEALGAIAFFGDKYGDLVRVLEAGRALARALRRDARARARLHRADQDPERGFRGCEPAAHRSRDRHWCARAHPRGGARTARRRREAQGRAR